MTSSCPSSSFSPPVPAASASRPLQRRRILMVLIDGVGDVSIEALNHRTPLQHARLPTLDWCAEHGVCGLMDPVAPGLACGSDTAHLSLLGYPPIHCYRGRGAFESMGAGLPMVRGDIAFKSNFAIWDEASGRVTKRRCDRDFPEWGVPLCDALCSIRLPSYPQIEVTVKHATEHRCGVRLRGPGLVDTINGTDPLKDNLPLLRAEASVDDHASHFTAAVVNELTEQIHGTLAAHPINVQRRVAGLPGTNMVLLRGCGGRIDVPPFKEMHGCRGFMVAPTAIIAGLGESVGMDTLATDGATGDYHTDLMAKAARAVAALDGDQYGFGFLHIKAVDDAGHDKNVALKVDWLQRVDAMLQWIVDHVNDNTTKNSGDDDADGDGDGDGGLCLVVTGDHSTPVLYGDHSCQPVPIVLCPLGGMATEDERWSALLAVDTVTKFDEVACADGGVLGRFPGDELMPLLHRMVGAVTGNVAATEGVPPL